MAFSSTQTASGITGATGATGATGNTGDTGAAGADGAVWTSSTSGGTGGADGDFHFNTTTDEISKKAGGSWSVIADITGQMDLTLDQSWTGAQRGTIVTNNDNSFDLTAGNNFKCTVPSAGLSNVTFTGISAASGQSGYILLVNSGYTITLTASTTDVDAEFLTSISGATGTFLISYLCDGTVVYLINSKALS